MPMHPVWPSLIASLTLAVTPLGAYAVPGGTALDLNLPGAGTTAGAEIRNIVLYSDNGGTIERSTPAGTDYRNYRCAYCPAALSPCTRAPSFPRRPKANSRA